MYTLLAIPLKGKEHPQTLGTIIMVQIRKELWQRTVCNVVVGKYEVQEFPSFMTEFYFNGLGHDIMEGSQQLMSSYLNLEGHWEWEAKIDWLDDKRKCYFTANANTSIKRISVLKSRSTWKSNFLLDLDFFERWFIEKFCD